MSKTPNQTKKITLAGNDYELNYPLTGGLIDIELKKDQYSNGSYNSLLKTETFAALNARSCIDMIATFTSLIPELKDHLKVTSMFKLTAIQSRDFVKIYLDEVLPWLVEWEHFLNNIEEVEEKKD